MGALEVRIRLALVGPPGAGKTAAIEHLHRTTPADQRGPLVQLCDRSGRTLLYDHLELQWGQVGALPLFVDIYSLPGAPHAVLARRMVLTGCDGFVFVTDGRDQALADTQAAFFELCDYLGHRERTPETAALVAALTRKDLTRGAPGVVDAALREHLGDRVLHVSTKTGEGMTEAVKKCAALVLARERDALEAAREGAPPPRVAVPAALDEEVEVAHALYLRASSQIGPGSSPHSDAFFGHVLLELGAVSQADLDEALRLRAEANRLALGVSLEEILAKRGMIDPDVIPRARLVRACVEVIHEEVVLGKVLTDLDAVPFARVKHALTLQAKRSFHNSLDHILTRAGALERVVRRQALVRLAQIHQGELLRDDQNLDPGHADSSAAYETRSKAAVPLFGEVCVSLGLVTKDQLRECLEEQRRLRHEGKRRFIGSLLQQRGYLSEDDVRRVCTALEEKIADDRIAGYRIICPLGRGNMALVFAATQVNLDRVVALKILDPKLLFDSEFVERFLREAQAAARLNHPNIVQAYDVGSSQELHYFAMEYVDGVTARELLERSPSGRLDEDTAIDVIVQVARALDHAAKHALVHRDVKPGNVMINRDGVVKLCDLGLATTLDAESPGQESALILGSPYYIAPEQIEGRADLDTRADIYSLGATLFHLLTGRPPFPGRTPEDVCLKHLSEPVPSPSEVVPSLTQRLTPVIFKMMAKDRDQRYTTCADVVRALLAIRPEAGNDERQAALAQRVRAGFPSRRLNKRGAPQLPKGWPQ